PVPDGVVSGFWLGEAGLQIAIAGGQVDVLSGHGWSVDGTAPSGAHAVWGPPQGPVWVVGPRFVCAGTPGKWRCQELDIGSGALVSGRTAHGPVFIGGQNGLWRADPLNAPTDVTELP
ncbi:MAG: hypothetical protein RJA70_1914, partial [Pseudomonadota bacterium]